MPTEEARRRAGLLNERRINRLSLAGLALSFVLLMAAFLAVLDGFRTTERSSSLVNHTYRVKDTLDNAIVHLERAEAARRGFLLNPVTLRRDTYRQSVSALLQTLDELDSLTLDNPRQRDRLVRLQPLIQEELRELESSVRLIENGEAEFARELFAQSGELQRLTQIRQIAQAIEQDEDDLLVERLDGERSSLGRVQLLLAIIAIGLLITALGTIWVLRRQLRAVWESRTELARVNQGLESAVAARTADLRRANEEIQRFAYIVSHDLRSPLVNVMGFTAELETADEHLASFLETLERDHPTLVTQEARNAVREDLPEAIEFIRTSTQRMDRLINAILGLSRQGRRVLEPDDLDMEEVLEDIADSLATLAEEREAEIRIEGPLPRITHDRIAIEQIFTNLMENALKYLRPDEPGLVRVRGRLRDDGFAEFEVEDNGRGVKESDHERIFDLFRRSGAQDQQGEGIGLANVRALAYRLGGTVKIASRFGQGSTFTVALPQEFHDNERDKA